MLNSKNKEQVFTNCTTGGPVNVYVKAGKITRIEPMELSKDDATWVIEARGKKFSPENRARVAPYALAERSRIYGTTRILHPLLREDFDVKGDRKAENRGKSGYKAISWEKALDILCSEINANPS